MELNSYYMVTEDTGIWAGPFETDVKAWAWCSNQPWVEDWQGQNWKCIHVTGEPTFK